MNTQSTSTGTNLSGIGTGNPLQETSRRLNELANQARSSVSQAQDPKAQALLETTAEVLLGLKKAYDDYEKGDEEAWQ